MGVENNFLSTNPKDMVGELEQGQGSEKDKNEKVSLLRQLSTTAPKQGAHRGPVVSPRWHNPEEGSPNLTLVL